MTKKHFSKNPFNEQESILEDDIPDIILSLVSQLMDDEDGDCCCCDECEEGDEGEAWEGDDDGDDGDDGEEWDDDELDEEEFENALQICCMAWNMAAVPPAMGQQALDMIIRDIKEQQGEEFDSEMITFIKSFAKQIKELFPVINHIIVSQEVEFLEDGPEVSFELASLEEMLDSE